MAIQYIQSGNAKIGEAGIGGIPWVDLFVSDTTGLPAGTQLPTGLFDKLGNVPEFFVNSIVLADSFEFTSTREEVVIKNMIGNPVGISKGTPTGTFSFSGIVGKQNGATATVGSVMNPFIDFTNFYLRFTRDKTVLPVKLDLPPVFHFYEDADTTGDVAGDPVIPVCSVLSPNNCQITCASEDVVRYQLSGTILQIMKVNPSDPAN